MNTTPAKRTLIVCRQAPYGSALSRAAVDVALATAVFEQALAVVFTGDGVWQLSKQQDSNAIDCKNHSKALSAFGMYDISELYVDGTSLTQRQLDSSDLIIEAKVLDRPSLGQLIDSFDTILNF